MTLALESGVFAGEKRIELNACIQTQWHVLYSKQWQRQGQLNRARSF